MSQSRRSPQRDGPAPVGLEFAAALLPLWGFPAGTGIAPADEQGTNNRTFLVRHGQQCCGSAGSCPSRRSAPSGCAAQRCCAGLAHRPALGPAGRPAGRRLVRRAAFGRDERRAGRALDFELAGAGFRVQDILAALYNSTALGAPDWPRRTAAFLRGCASVRHLEPAEVATPPELLIARSLGSVLWRATRWRDDAGTRLMLPGTGV